MTTATLVQEEVTQEMTPTEVELLAALERIDELEAKLKAQASEAGNRTKKAVQDYKDQLAEKTAEVEQLKTIVAKQEALAEHQQQAIVELTQKAEDAYEAHNEMVRKLDAIMLIMGK